MSVYGMISKTSITDTTSDIIYTANSTTIISKICITNLRTSDVTINIHTLDTSENFYDNSNISHVVTIPTNSTYEIEGILLNTNQKLAFSTSTTDTNPVNIIIYGYTR